MLLLVTTSSVINATATTLIRDSGMWLVGSTVPGLAGFPMEAAVGLSFATGYEAELLVRRWSLRGNSMVRYRLPLDEEITRTTRHGFSRYFKKFCA